MNQAIKNHFIQANQHIDNIEALFIKGNKRIKELEDGVREIHEKARIQGYDGGHAGIDAICTRLLRK